MARNSVLYSDQWGDIIDRSDDDCVEIRWFDISSGMDADDFNGFLLKYAECVEKSSRAGGLVDAVQFKMDMAKMHMGWRDEHIIPRYNAAGMKKFAFIMPAGMPAIGKPPEREGPADFPTAYFGTRYDALQWLKT